MKKLFDYLNMGKPQESPTLCVKTQNYEIENGILISFTVTSEVCRIPEGVTELKPFAINYDRDKIRKVILPASLRYIRRNNFWSCVNLEQVQIGEGLLEIEENAFQDCRSLKELHLPASLRKIGGKAFSCCTSLARLHLEEGLVEIGENAFDGCDSLKELDLPGSIHRLRKNAFSNCRELERLTVGRGLREIGESAFLNCTKLSQVSFGEGLRMIGDSAFFCTAIQTLQLPKGLTAIGNHAFYGCSALSAVYMPDVPAQMGNQVFRGCGNVRRWDVPPELLKPGFVIKNGVLEETICAVDPEELTVPEGVTKLGRKSIHNGAKRVVLPRSLRVVGESAFYLSQAESVTVPAGVEVIESDAFNWSSRMRQLHLPDTVRTLGRGAFSQCRGLESVKLPAGITEIESNLFAECVSLREIEIPAGVREIGSWAFSGCKELQKVVLPEGLEVIDWSAFEKCQSLTEVKLPSTLKSIGMKAFGYCSALEALSLPEGLTQLQENAFCGCKDLREIVIPQSVKALNSGVFAGCAGLRKAVLPTGVEAVSRYAFTGCVNLEEVVCDQPRRFEAALLDTPYWKRTYGEYASRKRLPLDLVGNLSGKQLNDRGYDLFDPERTYHIALPGEDGVVEVTSYAGEDGPDEDGFGREIYYDWWLLDEELKQIPGVPMWQNMSRLDMRNREAQWNALRAKAAEIVGNR